MKLLGIVSLIVTGIGAGFGSQYLKDEVIDVRDETEYFCHFEEDFGVFFLESLNEEDRLLVETELNRLLEENDLTLDDLDESHYLRHEIMSDLWDFIYENDIEFDESGHHGHMRWR